MTKKVVTLEEMKAAVTQVYNDYNGNIPVIFKIRASSEELYGKATEKYPELKDASGAYLPRGDHLGRNRGQSYMYFQSSAILYDPKGKRQYTGSYGEVRENNGRAIEAATKVVKHEVLGHYALNTCSKEEKLKILTTLVNNKEEPSLKDVWQKVEKYYPDISKLKQAEEVYSFTAEKGVILDPNYKRSQEKFSLNDLEQLSAAIGEGIRTGQRTQQIFPKNNGAQFKMDFIYEL